MKVFEQVHARPEILVIKPEIWSETDFDRNLFKSVNIEIKFVNVHSNLLSTYTNIYIYMHLILNTGFVAGQ